MQELTKLIKQNRPFSFEGLDIRPSFRASDTGAHTYSVNIMVTEEQWNSLKTIPRHKLIGGMLYWYEEDGDLNPDTLMEGMLSTVEAAETAGKKKKPDEEPKGIYGGYWSALFKKGFQNQPDLTDYLACVPKQVREKLHEQFKTTSLTFVNPGTFEHFIEEAGLPASLITLSRQATLEAAEQGSPA
jgi:hypothetical protein